MHIEPFLNVYPLFAPIPSNLRYHVMDADKDTHSIELPLESDDTTWEGALQLGLLCLLSEPQEGPAPP